MRAWLAYVRTVLLARLAWRGDWALGAVGDLVTAGIGLVMVVAIFHAVPLVRGWTREELLVCWGVAEAARSLCWMTCRGLYVANSIYVVGGELDRLLLRPLHPLAQILLEHVHLGAWPGIVWGVGVVWWAHGGLTVEEAGVLAVGVLGGTAILAGVLVAFSSIGLYVLHRGSAVGLVWQATAFAPYPPTFLPWPVALALATVLPFTFVGFAPGCWLLDHEVPGWVWLQPAVAVAVLALGLRAWQSGLARYGSAGT
ncbi:MAG: ABC-2 family transporter protein [Alphaproteobacteria bacterium]|nr:ABC-2 family transporter protein [Alphaproteobacteria bacterium]